MTDIRQITEEEARHAGAVCGALLFGYLWQIQHESAEPRTIPITASQTAGRKFITAKQAAALMEIGRSSFYALRDSDSDFPQQHQTPSGAWRYLRAEIVKYNTKRTNLNRKA
jgi:predicted DNA-binding transcriptional regulator AlpA